MTRKELEEYKDILKEIDSLEIKIDKELDKEIETVPGTVMSSMKRFPYTRTRVSVWMLDPEKEELSNQIVAVYKERLREAEKKKLEIEQFISSIPDSQLRLIFQYTFIDGLKQREVAGLVNLERSSISKKISDYLNFHTIHKKSVI